MTFNKYSGYDNMMVMMVGGECTIDSISRKIETQQNSMITSRVMPDQGTKIYSVPHFWYSGKKLGCLVTFCIVAQFITSKIEIPFLQESHGKYKG